MIVQVAVLLVLTLAALGMGWFSGAYLNNQAAASTGDTAAAEKADTGHDEKKADASHGEGHGAGGEPAAEGGVVEHNPMVVALAPLTTNLAAPAETWVRLEAAIVIDGTAPPELPDAIHQDLLAFVRTLKLHQIEGASGFQHFKADLVGRAAIRSEGHVKDVLIRTLLFE